MPSESSTNPQRGSFRSNLNGSGRRRSSTQKQNPNMKPVNHIPRSVGNLANNPNSDTFGTGDLSGLSVLDGFNPQLMAYLNDSDDGNSFAIATSSEDESTNNNEEIDLGDLDDDDIEAEEEAAIRTEIGRRKSLPGPLSYRRLSHSHPNIEGEPEAGASNDKDHESTPNKELDTPNNEDKDERDSSESSSSSWGPDFLDNYFDQPGSVQPLPEPVQNNDPNDDSYLWQYFFSSDEDEANNLNPLMRSKQRRASRTTKQTPSNRRGQSPNDQFHGFSPGAPTVTADDSFFVDPNSNQDFLNFVNEEPTELNVDGGSTDDDVPLKGRGPLPGAQLAAMDQRNHVPSGDSTDEDDGVPPERKRKRARGSKAIEVLGANSFSAQPPILGSWRIRGDKNVGIIDGLTTRTLSLPPPPPLAYPPSASNSAGNTPQSHSGETPRDPFEGLGDHDFTDFTESPANNPKRINEPSPMTSFLGLDDVEVNLPENGPDDAEVSDLDLLELGDFINTENMSSGDDGQVYEFDLMLEPSQDSQSGGDRTTKAPVSPYLYRNRMSNRNTPVAAFRNRASPYVNNSGYAVDGFGTAQRRRRSSASRRPSFNKDSYSVNKKRIKKPRTGSISKGRSGSNGNAFYDLGENEHDFIGELVEIGAMSPIYEHAE